MNCRTAQEIILEGLLAPGGAPDALDAHLAACRECRAFREIQSALDRSLAAAYAPPPLSPAFRAGLRRRLRAERRRALWTWAPDLLHVAGGLAVTAGAVWLVPAAPGPVLAAGLAATLATYLLQTVLRVLLEDVERL